MKRGDITAREAYSTLTEPMYYILLALTEECCGVDIMRRVEELSGKRITVGPGTVYALLAKFEENEIIRATNILGRRRSYIITDTGQQMLNDEFKRLKKMVCDGKELLESGETE